MNPYEAELNDAVEMVKSIEAMRVRLDYLRICGMDTGALHVHDCRIFGMITTVENRGDEEYPYQRSFIHNGIKVISLHESISE